ncbi:MAG: tetratricopeptide repeat protein [Alphaproteobacteria bacterium]|nr:tetratricopeptide repeat protein [Alphaproteobacteria bacterium]
MTKTLSLCFALMFAAAVPAAAAGGGGGNDGNSNASPTTHKCKSGEVWSKNKKKCVKAQSGVLPDEELYEQGRALAKEGHYDWALQVLAAIGDQNDPKVLNYTGYSHRKAGRLDIGITYYRKALAINPGFVLAREYLGEGYVAAGRVDLAMAELKEIARYCGTACEEYRDLSAAITAAN